MFDLINTLSESRLFPSTKSLTRLDTRDAADLAHAHICALRILLHEEDSRSWAERLAKRTTEAANFGRWRADATDLYALLFSLCSSASPLDNSDRELRKDLTINQTLIRNWLARDSHGHDTETMTKLLFGRLDAMFRIRDQSLRSMRRLVQDWPELTKHERKLVVTKLLQVLRARAGTGEMLPKIEALAKRDHLEIADACNPENGDECGGEPSDHAKKHPKFGTLAKVAAFGKKMETASSGATASSAIAASPGALGAGFDSDHSKSIYPAPKTKKPVVLRRTPLNEAAVTLPNGQRIIVMRNPAIDVLIDSCKKSTDRHLRGIIENKNVWWWDAEQAIHGTIADALGLQDYVPNRVHLIANKTQVRFDVSDESWPFSKLSTHRYLMKMIESPEIYLYLGGNGWISGPEWTSEWVNA